MWLMRQWQRVNFYDHNINPGKTVSINNTTTIEIKFGMIEDNTHNQIKANQHEFL